MRVDIKFCGMTRQEDAQHAVSLGAHYVGVIFAGGPRMLTVEQADDVFRDIPRAVHRVGVFAEQSSPDIARIAERLGLDVVQLHSSATTARVKDVRRDFTGEIWPVVRVVDGELPSDFSELVDAADGVLLDAFSPLALGGTGVALPWRALSDDLRQRRGDTPIILAGGLTPDNVSRAIGDLAPNVVDVSSGVESSPGTKDHQRMRAFRDAVMDASRFDSSTTTSPK